MISASFFATPGNVLNCSNVELIVILFIHCAFYDHVPSQLFSFPETDFSSKY